MWFSANLSEQFKRIAFTFSLTGYFEPEDKTGLETSALI
jgi:hypothetical protein